MKTASRLQGLTASPTMAVMQKAQELQSQGIDVIDLGPGEPDFPTPFPIRQAGIEAIESGYTRYTASAGLKELREAVAQRFNQRWDAGFSFRNVIVTAGAKSAIYSLCMALFESGDQVLNPVPYWVTFPEAIRLSGADCVEVPTLPEEGFVLSADQVSKNLSGTVRGLIVCTPSNPTGAVIPADTVQELMELGRSNQTFLIFDETYDYFTYEDQSHASLASFVDPEEPGYGIVGSFSKTYSMTGWRVGYCLASTQLISKLSEFQSHQSGNPCSISQRAALAALRQGPEMVEGMKREYANRRGFVLESLRELPGFKIHPPAGAFYVFPGVKEAMQRIGVETSQDFSSFLLEEARVATVPGAAFGMEDHIRLSYATSMENLEEAFSRIQGAMS